MGASSLFVAAENLLLLLQNLVFVEWEYSVTLVDVVEAAVVAVVVVVVAEQSSHFQGN